MATNTYVALDKITVGSSTPSVTFTGISQSYTDLVVEMNIQGVAGSGSGANTVYMTFNGDTTSGLYSRTILLGDSGGAQSSRTSGQNKINLGNAYESASASSIFGTMILNVQNYSNSTTNKTVLNRYSSNADRVGAVVGLWRNTNAITSLTITVDSSTGNIAAGSTFSLYGIAASPALSPSAKATGGTITTDQFGYVYHTFTSSGTFTPSQSLSCDALVIAGGGGGGQQSGGGGGAGGFLSLTSQSLSATGYTITVGGGGAGSSSSSRGTSGSDSSVGALTAAVGGGGGGTQGGTATGAAGGSGGGGSYSGQAGGAATIPQGFAGGSGSIDAGSGGGGGGAGALGTNGQTGSPYAAGNGGAGSNAFASWALITSTGSGGYYAGGGGGGNNSGGNAVGTGGAGGGGTGRRDNTSGSAGTTNTGSGGGGGGATTGGYAGGSGLVIIRYYGA